MNFRGRCFCCLFIVQSMSLYIDMKMMRSFKSCGRISSSSPFNFLDFLEKLRRCVPWENSPLEHDRLSVNVVQLAILQGLTRNTQFFPVSMLFGDRGSSGNFPPRHSTESEKTCTSAFNCSNIVTCHRVQDVHGLRLQSSLHGSSSPPKKKAIVSDTVFHSHARGTATQFPAIQPGTKDAPVILFPEDNLLASTLSGMGGMAFFRASSITSSTVSHKLLFFKSLF